VNFLHKSQKIIFYIFFYDAGNVVNNHLANVVIEIFLKCIAS
jgi:hypothetical protein